MPALLLFIIIPYSPARKGRPNRNKAARLYKRAIIVCFSAVARPCRFARFNTFCCSTVENGISCSSALAAIKMGLIQKDGIFETTL